MATALDASMDSANHAQALHLHSPKTPDLSNQPLVPRTAHTSPSAAETAHPTHCRQCRSPSRAAPPQPLPPTKENTDVLDQASHPTRLTPDVVQAGITHDGSRAAALPGRVQPHPRLAPPPATVHIKTYYQVFLDQALNPWTALSATQRQSLCRLASNILAAVLQPFLDDANHAQPPQATTPKRTLGEPRRWGPARVPCTMLCCALPAACCRPGPRWAGLLRELKVWELAFGAQVRLFFVLFCFGFSSSLFMCCLFWLEVRERQGKTMEAEGLGACHWAQVQPGMLMFNHHFSIVFSHFVGVV